MTELTWGEPPKRKSGGGRGRTPSPEEVATAEELVKHPGEWAQVKTFDGEKAGVRAASLATQIKTDGRGGYAQVLEAVGVGGFDTSSRSVGDGVSATFVRYVEDAADVSYQPRATA